MTDQSHTPLPWWTDTEGRGDQEYNVVCASLGAHGTQVVVDDLNAGHLLDPDERYANAALIVRSVNSLPSLVKALEEIASEVNRMVEAVEAVACHQEQCDEDGVMVKVSRQAVDELAGAFEFINHASRSALSSYRGGSK